MQRQRLGAPVDLDTGDDAPARQQLGERDIVARALAQGFVEQDDAADLALDAVGGEQDLAVAPALFLGGLHLDRQYPLVLRNNGFRHGLEFVDVHGLWPSFRNK
jgi:hypothetical protein